MCCGEFDVADRLQSHLSNILEPFRSKHGASKQHFVLNPQATDPRSAQHANLRIPAAKCKARFGGAKFRAESLTISFASQ